MIIVGNDETPDYIIRDRVAIYPGQAISLANLRTAEGNLTRLKLFVVDEKNGIRPTITLLEGPPGSEYQDLLIQVHEKPNNRYLYAATDGIIFLLSKNPYKLHEAVVRIRRSW